MSTAMTPRTPTSVIPKQKSTQGTPRRSRDRSQSKDRSQSLETSTEEVKDVKEVREVKDEREGDEELDDSMTLPFMRQDKFSDVVLQVGGRRLYTCKNLLAYNSPVMDEILSSEKKDKQKDLDLPQKEYEDVVELLSYIDPRVEYTITEERAMRLLPLAEEYQMERLKRECEDVVVAAFKAKRKEYRKPGMMPLDEVLRYLQVGDKCNCTNLLDVTMNEFAANPQTEITKALLERGDLSERVKLLALNKRLQKVNFQLEKEHRERTNIESKLALHTKKLWRR